MLQLSHPPDIHLSLPPKTRTTTPQIKILKALAIHGPMTFDALCHVVGISYHGATRTTARLLARNHVTRCCWLDSAAHTKTYGGMFPKYVTAISTAGRQHLIDRGHINEDDPSTVRHWTGGLESLRTLEHDLSAAKAMARIKTGFDDHERYRVLRCIDGRAKTNLMQNGKKVFGYACRDSLPTRGFVVADGILRVQNIDTKNTTTMSLEYERYFSTPRVPERVAKKLKRYKELLLHPYRRFYDRSCALLYVTSKRWRVMDILMTDEARPLWGVMRIAHLEDILDDPLGYVWTTIAERDGRFAAVKWSLGQGFER